MSDYFSRRRTCQIKLLWSVSATAIHSSALCVSVLHWECIMFKVTVCLCHFKCVTQSVLKFPELRRSLSVQYFMQQMTTAGLEYLEFSIKDNCSGNPNSMKFRIHLLLSHVTGAICNCIFD